MKDYHVSIIGGGPAGLATALALKNHANASGEKFHIDVFEANGKAKAKIGETIPPAATPILRDLVGEHLDRMLAEHTVCPGSLSLWGSDQPGMNDFMFDLDGQGYHLDRKRFEEQLSDIAQHKGIHLNPHSRLAQLSKNKHGFSLQLNKKTERQTINTDFVVDATGCAAVSARRLDIARNTFDEVLYIGALIDDQATQIQPVLMPTRTLVESCSYGWWYAAKLPGNKLIVTLCTDTQQMQEQNLDNLNVWYSLLNQTQLIRETLKERLTERLTDQVTLFKRGASSSILSAVVAQNWLAVGDAASSYDPISSAGITKALMHGQLAGSSVHDALAKRSTSTLSHYQDQVFSDFNQYVGLRYSLYASEQRFMQSGYWQRRLGLSNTD
ncbi:tryptophan 7-halogenase [Vibrio sp. Isolate25]|uniref:NAD(P)/FAD-dependent oxidoreductase n=1 Tax=unclassified Vibrio TaxID=2614977 RepID=UPI001EFEDC7F|nr:MULTISPECIES: tryptophan 7-halogenase [unclassified Vibrio]MCG9599008.1 tryptophan 7-halogenase [Vibrio sp. Isolate25]MCG9680221.1 tryptophan 7-halogenase [Vibrio sp. Isolate24]